MQSNLGGQQTASSTVPLAAFAMRGGGTATLYPDRLALPERALPVATLNWAGLVVDTSVPVAPGAWPLPAVGLRVSDGSAAQVAVADPPEAWRLLESLYQLRPDLRQPVPPPPTRAPYPAPMAAGQGASSSSDTVLAGLSHLSIFFAPVILPLIVWLVTRRTSPYTSRQAKQAFFFHLIYSVVAIGLYVGAMISMFGSFFTMSANGNYSTFNATPFVAFFAIYGVVLLLMLVEIGFSIYGAVQAFQGRPFSYPFLGRL